MSKKPEKSKPAPEHKERAYLGLAYYVRKKNDTRWVLRPRWGLLSALFVTALALLHVASACTLYWVNRYYRECEETSLGDMFYYVIPNHIPFTKITILPAPLNRKVVNARLSQQEKFGNMLSKDPKNIHELFMAARLAPKNVRAQFRAAYFLMTPDFGINRTNDGFDLLDLAMPYVIEEPPEECAQFILRYAQLCFLYDQDKRVIATAEKWLDDPRLSRDARVNLATSYAEALFLRGEMMKAAGVLGKYNLEKTMSGFLLRTQITWENGQQDDAINLLKKTLESLREGKDKLLYSLAKFHWEREENEEAAKALAAAAAVNPSDYKAGIYTLPLLHGDAYKARRQAIIEDTLKRFGTDELAMISLGSYAAEYGNIELQQRVNKLATENRFSHVSNFRLLVVETLLSAGKNVDAINQIGDLFRQKPTWLQTDPRLQDQFEALRMLAYFSNGQDDLGVITFNEILKKNRMTVPLMVSVGRRLLKIKRPNEAKALLLSAYTSNHNNLGALLELVKIDLKSESTATLGEHLTHLLEARRPPRYVLVDAYEHLASDRFIFTPNRAKLLEDITTMLETRVLPKSEIEKSWPAY